VRSRAVGSLALLALLGAAAGAGAVEKASDQVHAFHGSFSQAVPIQTPAYHGLEPSLALAYSSEGRNGFAGVGWTVAGINSIERANAGRGTPHWDAADIFLLNGQELVACAAGSVSPSCTTGGTHSTKQESYVKIRFDSTAGRSSAAPPGSGRTPHSSRSTKPAAATCSAASRRSSASRRSALTVPRSAPASRRRVDGSGWRPRRAP